MQTKSALNTLGTLLFLLGVFGYIFPRLPHTFFSNNENLFHVVAGLVLLGLASGATALRRKTLFVASILFLIIGLYGFFAGNPEFVQIRKLSFDTYLNEADNYIHIGLGLALAWFWIASASKAQR